MTPEERRAATEALYQHWHRMVYGLALDLMRNTQDAEDVVQETFLKVYLRLPDDADERIGGWVGRIGINTAKDALRAQRRRPLFRFLAPDGTTDDAEPMPAWVTAAHTPEEQVVDRVTAVTYLTSMAPPVARFFRYIATTASSHSEAAAHFGIPIGTLKTQMRRQRLRVLQEEAA